jgi:predicted nucleic acid-binding protein
MIIFLDTNVLLDYFLSRKPFHLAASQIISLAEVDRIVIYASSLGFSTTYYFARRYTSHLISMKKLKLLRGLISISPIDEKIIDLGLNSNFTDLKDAIQYYSAHRINANYLITRNKKDYKESIAS